MLLVPMLLCGVLSGIDAAQRSSMQIAGTAVGRVARAAQMATVLTMGMLMASVSGEMQGQAAGVAFGPSNPFYAASTLPYQAPPFDKIHDADYQPAIEEGMVEQWREIAAIASNPAAPTFE